RGALTGRRQRRVGEDDQRFPSADHVRERGRSRVARPQGRRKRTSVYESGRRRRRSRRLVCWSRTQNTKIRTSTAPSSCAIRQTVVVHDSPDAVYAPRKRASVTKKPPTPRRISAAMTIDVVPPPPPATARIDVATVPVKSANRPKTKTVMCWAGDRPMSHSLSPIPAIEATSNPEEGGGVREYEQQGDERDNQKEQADEDIHFFKEQRGPNEADDDEEHPEVGDRRANEDAQIGVGGRQLWRWTNDYLVAKVDDHRADSEEQQAQANRSGDHHSGSTHHHRGTHHRGRWFTLHPIPTLGGAVMFRFIYITLNEPLI